MAAKASVTKADIGAELLDSLRAVTHAVRPRPTLMIDQYSIRCRFRNSR
jgi:hypothetical protein